MLRGIDFIILQNLTGIKFPNLDYLYQNTKCILCESDYSLYVVYHRAYDIYTFYCNNCHFTGDSIDLLSKFWNVNIDEVISRVKNYVIPKYKKYFNNSKLIEKYKRQNYKTNILIPQTLAEGAWNYCDKLRVDDIDLAEVARLDMRILDRERFSKYVVHNKNFIIGYLGYDELKQKNYKFLLNTIDKNITNSILYFPFFHSPNFYAGSYRLCLNKKSHIIDTSFRVYCQYAKLNYSNNFSFLPAAGLWGMPNIFAGGKISFKSVANTVFIFSSDLIIQACRLQLYYLRFSNTGLPLFCYYYGDGYHTYGSPNLIKISTDIDCLKMFSGKKIVFITHRLDPFVIAACELYGALVIIPESDLLTNDVYDYSETTLLKLCANALSWNKYVRGTQVWRNKLDIDKIIDETEKYFAIDRSVLLRKVVTRGKLAFFPYLKNVDFFISNNKRICLYNNKLYLHRTGRQNERYIMLCEIPFIIINVTTYKGITFYVIKLINNNKQHNIVSEARYFRKRYKKIIQDRCEYAYKFYPYMNDKIVNLIDVVMRLYPPRCIILDPDDCKWVYEQCIAYEVLLINLRNEVNNIPKELQAIPNHIRKVVHEILQGYPDQRHRISRPPKSSANSE